MIDGKLAAQRECYQERDDEPTIVQPDRNTEDSTKLDVCFHVALIREKSYEKSKCVSRNLATYFRPCLSGVNNRSVAKFIMLKTIAISYRLKAAAAPIAPVFQMLAAVAVPRTLPRSFRMAPPPIKPIPVIRP